MLTRDDGALSAGAPHRALVRPPATEEGVRGGVQGLGGAWPGEQLTALFVHQHLADGALETLPPQAPDTVATESARCSLTIKCA